MGPQHLDLNRRPTSGMTALYDKWLLLAGIGIIAYGLLMVASSSIVISERIYNQPFHYLIRQAIYLAGGVIAALVVIRIEMSFWQRVSGLAILVAIAMLVLVLVPGLGHSVNGSTRWLGVGPLRFQVSELAKLLVLMYLAGYLVRHQQSAQQDFIGFIKPLAIVTIIAGLLLLEPDFGASVVILATVLGVLFLSGVRLSYFIFIVIIAAAAVALLAVSSPYRMARLTSFLNPWARQYDSGYQLTQSLIAFGRGGWLGVGLGDSVQKLFYLPEAHTDFLFAVLAEELGLLGILLLFSLFGLLISRGFIIARRAQRENLLFSAYLTYGLTLWLCLQTMINLGVNSGVLPTKGLTLPFMSYGGSSLVVMCTVLALILRVDHETRWHILGLSSSGRRS